jgi:hypothetical protein
MSDIEFGLDVDPETGAADSEDLKVDLPDLFSAGVGISSVKSCRLLTDLFASNTGNF